MTRRFYAMKDSKEENQTPLLIHKDEARDYNNRLYGIFQEVNSFNGPRSNDNILYINYWYAEMDGGDKADQLNRIRQLQIYPSMVIESKNGYHIYFKAQDATKENYKTIQDGIGKQIGGDPQVRDLARILRSPGFYHWKDKNDPFYVKEIMRFDVSYREKEMLYFFPLKQEPVSVDNPKDIVYTQDDLTEFLNALDHEYALTKLSGTSYVNYETYTFKPVSGGHLNIIVNGKSTNCFIDTDKKIGAIPGGPTLFQWLRYYNHSDKECYRIIKETIWK